jgi:hypothetical protein
MSGVVFNDKLPPGLLFFNIIIFFYKDTSCVVCHDVATGNHYSVPSCNGLVFLPKNILYNFSCKTFFRRAIVVRQNFFKFNLKNFRTTENFYAWVMEIVLLIKVYFLIYIFLNIYFLKVLDVLVEHVV